MVDTRGMYTRSFDHNLRVLQISIIQTWEINQKDLVGKWLAGIESAQIVTNMGNIHWYAENGYQPRKQNCKKWWVPRKMGPRWGIKCLKLAKFGLAEPFTASLQNGVFPP